MDYKKEMEDEMDMEEEESYVPLNWDKLSSNPDVWEVIKEEMDNKFEAECLMKIITAAKEAGMKDAQIFLPIVPMEEVDYEDMMTTPFEDSTEEE